ncbi:MAG: PAS domain-containing protein [Bacteroidia bacterium]
MLRALYQSTSEACTFIDKEYKILYLNKVSKQFSKSVFGKEAEVGENSLDYIVPELREQYIEYYTRVLNGETVSVESFAGGFWWLFYMYPVYDNENNIIGISVNVQNITEQKSKAIQLEESENKLQKTIEAIPNPLVIVDDDLCINYVNEEFEKVFGYNFNEVEGKKVDFLLPESLRTKHRELQKNYLNNFSHSLKMGSIVTAIAKSGKEVYVSSSINSFVSNNKRYVIVILQDVTELKLQQDTILNQNDKLRAIAWHQSHIIRRPVANILALCNLLKDYKSEPEELFIKYMENLFKETTELDKLIKDIVSKANEIEKMN